MADRVPASRIADLPEELSPAFEDLEETIADPVEAAFERGREQGIAEGRAEAGGELEAAMRKELEEQAASLSGEVADALKRLGELRETLTRSHLELMKQLALEASSKIVRARIDGEDGVAARALQEAIDALPVGEKIQARLHPDDIEYVCRELDDELARSAVELVGDESISRGGCFLESAAGHVDATIETAESVVRAAVEDLTEST